jgi:hypothetical protein
LMLVRLVVAVTTRPGYTRTRRADTHAVLRTGSGRPLSEVAPGDTRSSSLPSCSTPQAATARASTGAPARSRGPSRLVRCPGPAAVSVRGCTQPPGREVGRDRGTRVGELVDAVPTHALRNLQHLRQRLCGRVRLRAGAGSGR